MLLEIFTAAHEALPVPSYTPDKRDKYLHKIKRALKRHPHRNLYKAIPTKDETDNLNQLESIKNLSNQIDTVT